MVKILSIFVAFLENMNFTQDVNGFGRMHSTSSQSPLTTTYKQPFHTKCLSLLGLSMFECCLIISNAIFILILMPMVFKISADVNDVRHDGLQEIKGTCVNNSNFTVYMLLALVRFCNFFFEWSKLVRFCAIINTLTILFISPVELLMHMCDGSLKMSKADIQSLLTEEVIFCYCKIVMKNDRNVSLQNSFVC